MSKVEFFHGGTNLIGTDLSSPYSVNWTSVPAGTYVVTAKATAVKKNNPDQTATSAPITVIVNVLPTVSMTSPANNAAFAAPGNITLTATAADSDGTVSKVEFFHGGTNLIATVTSPPYTHNWTGVAVGSYSLTAKATDNNNGTTTSTAVNINVSNGPSVTLTSPANGANFGAPANITLTATASDSDGIQKVEFFHGGTNLIATVTTPPYTHNWTNVGVASYTLTAKATDNLGIPTTSSPVNITVQGQAAAGLYFIHTDHLNTPRLIANATGQTAWQWENIDPFGGNAPNENPSGLGTLTCNLRLPGQYFDKETNLHYNYFRDYDPSIGRYIQSDPIGLRGGINTYAYAKSNPLTNIDPDGRRPYDLQIGIGGGIGHLVFGGGVYAATIKDVQSGATCRYQIRCFGVGFGLPEIGVTSKPVRFDDGQACSKCSDFSGLGYIGGGSIVTGAGATIGGGVWIPNNGPFVAGDYIGAEYGVFRIGVSHNACYFALQ